MGVRCSRCPEKRDTSSKNGGKMLEVSVKMGHLKHLRRKNGVDGAGCVPGVRKSGTLGTKSVQKCARCPEIRDTGNRDKILCNGCV